MMKGLLNNAFVYDERMRTIVRKSSIVIENYLYERKYFRT